MNTTTTNHTATTFATDPIGSEIYSSHFRERRMLLTIVFALAAVSIILAADVFHLSNRPVETHWVKIDEVGRATPIAYNDLKFTPTEAVIRQQLTTWATYRYSNLRNSVTKTYPRQYYFVQDSLASNLMQLDTRAGYVVKIATGQQEEHDAQINNVTFTTSIGKELIKGTPIYTGAAIIDLFKIFNSSYPPRREHWTVSVTFYLNPDAVSKKSVRFPQFEVINPLGLIITDFHESRATE